MTASERMAALVKAFGDAIERTTESGRGRRPSTAARVVEEGDAGSLLLAAIGEIERDRDGQAAEVARLREEVADLRAIDTTADEFVDALIAAWPAEDGPAPTAPMEAARYGLRRHLRRLREEVAALTEDHADARLAVEKSDREIVRLRGEVRRLTEAMLDGARRKVGNVTSAEDGIRWCEKMVAALTAPGPVVLPAADLTLTTSSRIATEHYGLAIFRQGVEVAPIELRTADRESLALALAPTLAKSKTGATVEAFDFPAIEWKPSGTSAHTFNRGGANGHVRLLNDLSWEWAIEITGHAPDEAAARATVERAHRLLKGSATARLAQTCPQCDAPEIHCAGCGTNASTAWECAECAAGGDAGREADRLRDAVVEAARAYRVSCGPATTRRAWDVLDTALAALEAHLAGKAPAPTVAQHPWINVVFDGPPGPVAGRFVEVEDARGHSIKVGQWLDEGDGKWVLRINLESELRHLAANQAPAQVAQPAPVEPAPRVEWLAMSSLVIDGWRVTVDRHLDNVATKPTREVVAAFVEHVETRGDSTPSPSDVERLAAAIDRADCIAEMWSATSAAEAILRHLAGPLPGADQAEELISAYVDAFAETSGTLCDRWAEIDQKRKDHAVATMRRALASLGAPAIDATALRWALVSVEDGDPLNQESRDRIAAELRRILKGAS